MTAENASNGIVVALNYALAAFHKQLLERDVEIRELESQIMRLEREQHQANTNFSALERKARNQIVQLEIDLDEAQTQLEQANANLTKLLQAQKKTPRQIAEEKLDGFSAEERLWLDAYYRAALEAVAGVKVPQHFRFLDTDQVNEQHNFCCSTKFLDWRCGVSLQEAAEAMVLDAVANGNIMSPGAAYAADWETDGRAGKKPKVRKRKKS